MSRARLSPAEQAAIAAVFEAYATAVRALAACEEAGFTGTEVIQSLESARDSAMHAYRVVSS